MQIIKKYGILALALCLCFGFSACKKSGHASTEPDPASDHSSVLLNNKWQSIQGAYILEDAQQNQLFSTVYNDESVSYLYFLDGVTAEKVLLCNAPNCQHTSNTCNAYFATAGGTVFMLGDTLYVLEQTTGSLLAMQPDGTNHASVLTIGSQYKIHQVFLYNEQLYLDAAYLPQQTANTNEELVFSQQDYPVALLAVDLSAKACRELFHFTNEPDTVLLGICREQACYQYTQQRTQQPLSQEQLHDIENNLQTAVYARSLEDGKKTQHLQTTANCLDSVIMHNALLYYHSREASAIQSYDLVSGKTQTVLANLGGYVRLENWSMFENKLFYTLDHEGNNAFTNVVQENEVYYYDFATKASTQVAYTYRLDPHLDVRLPFDGFYAQTEQYFILRIDTQGETLRLGKLKKDDFWANRFDAIIPLP